MTNAGSGSARILRAVCFAIPLARWKRALPGPRSKLDILDATFDIRNSEFDIRNSTLDTFPY